jgi:hypothetical protein
MIAVVLGIAIGSTETALVELRYQVVRVRVGIVPPTSPPMSPVTSIHPIGPAPSIEVGAVVSCAMSIVAIESTAATMRCKVVTTMASTSRIESWLEARVETSIMTSPPSPEATTAQSRHHHFDKGASRSRVLWWLILGSTVIGSSASTGKQCY